jgi:hypothetical protein
VGVVCRTAVAFQAGRAGYVEHSERSRARLLGVIRTKGRRALGRRALDSPGGYGRRLR